MKITDETPIVMLTVGQLKAIIRQEIAQRDLNQDASQEVVVKYAFGLRGIREEFNVSHATGTKI